MKPLKIIVAVCIALVIVGGAVLLWEMARRDEMRELRQDLMMGDAKALDLLLTSHPRLANAKDVEPKQGWRPLHAAAYSGNTEIIKVLLAHHADIEARDKRGLTPLLWTAFVGKPEAAAVLLSGGADINAKGRDGRTALELAKISLNQELITLLRERGAKE